MPLTEDEMRRFTLNKRNESGPQTSVSPALKGRLLPSIRSQTPMSESSSPSPIPPAGRRTLDTTGSEPMQSPRSRLRNIADLSPGPVSSPAASPNRTFPRFSQSAGQHVHLQPLIPAPDGLPDGQPSPSDGSQRFSRQLNSRSGALGWEFLLGPSSTRASRENSASMSSGEVLLGVTKLRDGLVPVPDQPASPGGSGQTLERRRQEALVDAGPVPPLINKPRIAALQVPSLDLSLVNGTGGGSGGLGGAAWPLSARGLEASALGRMSSPGTIQRPQTERTSMSGVSRLAVHLLSNGKLDMAGQSADLGSSSPGAQAPPKRESWSGAVNSGTPRSGSRLAGTNPWPTLDEIAVAMGLLASPSGDKRLFKRGAPALGRGSDSGEAGKMTPRLKSVSADVIEGRHRGGGLMFENAEADEHERSTPTSAEPTHSIVDILHPPSVRALVNMIQDHAAKSRQGYTNCGSIPNPAFDRGKASKVLSVQEILDSLPDVQSLPAPPNTHRVYHAGVSVKTILKLDSLLPPGPITTSTVMLNHILPITSKYSAKMSDLLSPQAVNLPKMYIIHAWSGDFHHLAQSLKQYCIDTAQDMASTHVFLDVLCCNMGTKLTLRDLATMKDIIGSCKSVLVMIDRSAAVLTRLWCIYEIWLAVSTGPARGFGKSNEHIKLILYNADLDHLADGLQHMMALRLHCHSPEERSLLLEDMVEEDHHGPGAPKAIVPVVRDGLILCSRSEAAKSIMHIKSAPRKYALSLQKLAMVQTAVGNHWEAEKALRQVVQLATQTANLMDEWEEMRYIAQLANCMLQRGFLDEADRLARQAQDWHEQAYNHRDTVSETEEALGRVLLTLASIAIKGDDLDRAEQLLERLLGCHYDKTGRHICRDMEPLLLPDSRALVHALGLLADLYRKQGKTDISELCVRDALSNAIIILGRDHVMVADLNMRLATKIQNRIRHQLEEADANLNEARRDALSNNLSTPRNTRTQRVSYSGESTRLRDALAAMATVKEQASEPLSEAMEMAQHALKVRQEMFGNDSQQSMEAEILIMHIMVSQGQYDKVEALLDKTITACEHTYGTSHPVSVFAQGVAHRLRDFYLTQGQTAKRMLDDTRAEEQLTKALYFSSLVLSEQDEKQIAHELQDLLRKQGRRLELVKVMPSTEDSPVPQQSSV